MIPSTLDTLNLNINKKSAQFIYIRKQSINNEERQKMCVTVKPRVHSTFNFNPFFHNDHKFYQVNCALLDFVADVVWRWIGEKNVEKSSKLKTGCRFSSSLLVFRVFVVFCRDMISFARYEKLFERKFHFSTLSSSSLVGLRGGREHREQSVSSRYRRKTSWKWKWTQRESRI